MIKAGHLYDHNLEKRDLHFGYNKSSIVLIRFIVQPCTSRQFCTRFPRSCQIPTSLRHRPSNTGASMGIKGHARAIAQRTSVLASVTIAQTSAR